MVSGLFQRPRVYRIMMTHVLVLCLTQAAGERDFPTVKQK